MKLRLGGLFVLAGFALDFWQPVARSLLFSLPPPSSSAFLFFSPFPPFCYPLPSVFSSRCPFSFFSSYAALFFLFERSRPTFTWPASTRSKLLSTSRFYLGRFYSYGERAGPRRQSARAPPLLSEAMHLKGLISPEVLQPVTLYRPIKIPAAFHPAIIYTYFCPGEIQRILPPLGPLYAGAKKLGFELTAGLILDRPNRGARFFLLFSNAARNALDDEIILPSYSFISHAY